MARIPAIATLLLLAGCGGTEAPDPPPTSFVAFLRDLAPYKTWERFDVAGEGDNGHGAGDRRIYLNERPARRATEFPVGTMIVKEIGDGQTFAMVKRGGTYNAQGARGWEWFELRPDTSGHLAIAWRGIAPPSGESYSGIKGGTCNDCHSVATDNDSVLAPSMKLSTLSGP